MKPPQLSLVSCKLISQWTASAPHPQDDFKGREMCFGPQQLVRLDLRVGDEEGGLLHKTKGLVQGVKPSSIRLVRTCKGGAVCYVGVRVPIFRAHEDARVYACPP